MLFQPFSFMKETSSCTHLSLNAEAESHAIRVVGVAVVSAAFAADITEAGATAPIRGTLPPVRGSIVDILDLAVSNLIVGVLTSLTGLGIGGRTEDFHLRQQEQFVTGRIDGTTTITSRSQLIDSFDGILKISWKSGENTIQH